MSESVWVMSAWPTPRVRLRRVRASTLATMPLAACSTRQSSSITTKRCTSGPVPASARAWAASMPAKPSAQQASSTAACSFMSVSGMPEMSTQSGRDRSNSTVVWPEKVSPRAPRVSAMTEPSSGLTAAR